MNITYAQNPLATVVELDDHDRAILRLKLEIEDLEDKIVSAEYDLKKGKIDEARAELDYSWMDGEKKAAREARFAEMVAYYEAELRSYHVGDCTCVACSCDKCHAEVMFGIDTTKGLGKHAGHKIACAFGKDGARSIDEALAYLRDYDPQPQAGREEAWAKLGGWAQYVPRWKAEAAEAFEWLKHYKAERLEHAAEPRKSEQAKSSN